MSEAKKYRLDELINNMPYNRAKLVYKWLPAQLGVTPKTFRVWRRLTINDSGTIPAEHFFRIASFFQVEPEKLFTEQPQAVKPAAPDANANQINDL